MQITNVMYSKMANNERMSNTGSPAFGASPIVQGGEKMLVASATAAAAAALAMLNSKNKMDLEALSQKVNELEGKLTDIRFDEDSEKSVTELADLYSDAKMIDKKLSSYRNNDTVKDAKERLSSAMMFLKPIILMMADTEADEYILPDVENPEDTEPEITNYLFMSRDKLEKNKEEVGKLLDVYTEVNEYTDTRNKLLTAEGYINTSLELDLASKNFDEVVEIYRKLPRMFKESDDRTQKVNYMLVESSIPNEAVVNKRWPDAHDLDEIFGDSIEG